MKVQSFKISMITPIYNNDQYLERCIQSGIKQTYRNLEILIINDDSTDKSLETCTDYAQKDSQIKLISQESQGVSVARNNGIIHSTGDLFVW